MKKTLVLAAFFLLSLSCMAQDPDSPPNVTLKWAPTGLVVGSVSLQAEYNYMGRNSLTAKIGIPANRKHSFEYEDKDAEFDMKATSFLAGYRMYLSKSKHLKGIYLEPFFKYVHHTSEGIGQGTLNNRTVTMSFTNNYNGFGVGAQLGAQFLIGKRFVIDLFLLGPEINSAKNNFKAVEVTNSIPWTHVEANEAEQDIRNFLDQFPFIRNKTDIMVNQASKTVTADFKGALPGIRTGVSFGIAF